MKLAKWKVLGVAGALVLGYAVSSQAFQLKVDDDTFMNVNYRLKVYVENLGDRGSGSQKKVDTAGLLSFDGQINNLVQFYADWTDSPNNPLTWDAAYINFAFAPEIQVEVGGDTVPFSALALQGSTKAVVPAGSVDPLDKINGDDAIPGGRGLIKVYGSAVDGMLNYAVALYDQRTNIPNRYEGFNYAFRIDFAPTMLGFKSGLGPSYLGKKDVLNIGFGYFSEKDAVGIAPNFDTTSGFTFDVTFEKNLGLIVPSAQLAYFNLSNTYYNPITNSFKGSSQITLQGQLLYNEVVGIGKPAIGLRIDKIEDEDAGKVTRLGVAFNYYIEGNAAKVSAVINNVKYDNVNVPKDSITDIILFAQVKF